MTSSSADLGRRFGGIARLYGPAALERFQQAHVCVIGVGGVGSWAVEALARSAIGSLTLIDLDNVAESNTNRQLPALDPHYGKAKVTALAERIHAINPGCVVTEVEDFVTEENLDAMLGQGFDFVIDCIDSLKVKTAITNWCVRRRQPFILSGGAGGQTDPTQIKVADLTEVTYDPLLSKLRYNLRKFHGFTREPGKKMRVPCVYSTEQLVYPEAQQCDTGEARGPQGLSCAGFGAAMTVTATFGLVAVSQALKHLAKTPRQQAK